MPVITDKSRGFYPVDMNGKITIQDLIDTISGGEGSLPQGTNRMVLSWDADGKVAAVPFTPNMWSDFPEGAPKDGDWMAAASFDAPEGTPTLGFVKVSTEPDEWTTVLRTSAGPNGDSGGRIKAAPGIFPEDVVNHAQLTVATNKLTELETEMIAQNATKASLVSGKVPYEQLPAFPVGRKVKVPDATSRMGLAPHTDLTIAYEQDTADAWALNPNDDPAIAGNWSKLGNAQATGVLTFNGRAGNIGPELGDYHTELIAETVNKRFVTPAQIALWNSAPNPGLIDSKIAEQKTANDLVYETKQHADSTFAHKTDRGSVNGLAPLNADLKMPMGYLYTSVVGGIAPLNSDLKLSSNWLYRNVANGVAGVDANSRVALANLPTHLPQSKRVWRNQLAQRTHGLWYTNDSGNEMELFLASNNAVDGSYFNVQMRADAGSATMAFISNSSASGAGLPSTRAFSNVTVPAGWQYSVNSSNIATRTITTWHELS